MLEFQYYQRNQRSIHHEKGIHTFSKDSYLCHRSLGARHLHIRIASNHRLRQHRLLRPYSIRTLRNGCALFHCALSIIKTFRLYRQEHSLLRAGCESFGEYKILCGCHQRIVCSWDAIHLLCSRPRRCSRCRAHRPHHHFCLSGDRSLCGSSPETSQECH